MKLSHSFGLTAAAAVLAVSGIASAATVTYVSDGYIVASDATCTSFGLALGTPEHSYVNLPAAGAAGMQLISPSTTPTSKTAGSTVTYVCLAGTGTTGTGAVGKLVVPKTGINGATMGFTCYGDGQAGKATTAAATASVVFTVVPTSDPTNTSTVLNSASVETAETLTIGSGKTAVSCKYTTDGTWTAQ